MRISYLTISNFRGIHHLPKIDCSHLNIFVGRNDSGKSIILKALDCFFNEKLFDLKDIYKAASSETILEIGFKPTEEIDDLATDIEGNIVIKKTFELQSGKIKSNTYYKSYDYENSDYQDLWSKKEQELNGLIQKLGSSPARSGRGNTNLDRISQIKSLLKGETRNEIYYDAKEYLGNLKKQYNIVLPDYSLFPAETELDVGATSFQSQFRHLITESLIKNKSKTEEIETALKEDLKTEFNEICGLMAKNVSGLEELIPEIESDWKKAIKFDVGMKFTGEAYSVPLSHKGTGFRRLLMVAYFEYLANRKDISNHIFAIEEPETYLHPSAQEELLFSIHILADTAQFFLTTHSPVFAGSSDGQYAVLVTKTEDGRSEYNRGDDILERIIAELGIKPDYNLLKNSKYLVFVEGRDDVLFWDAVGRTVAQKNLQDDGILCLIGGGSSLKNYADLDLFRKLSPGGKSDKYAVIIDGDNNEPTKEKAIKEIIEKCKEDGALFHRLKKREIENYCCEDKIKQVYIQEIIKSEGEGSQNPRIKEINALQINIDDESDIEQLLRGIGLNRFKGRYNISVFQEMSLEDWTSRDPNGELKGIVDSIYSKLAN
ncbi:MAG: AAA family ATPase [candidate division Zixibacteria bacterium]